MALDGFEGEDTAEDGLEGVDNDDDDEEDTGFKDGDDCTGPSEGELTALGFVAGTEEEEEEEEEGVVVDVPGVAVLR